MHDFDLLSYNDISEYWKEGEDSGKSSFSIDDKKRYMVDLEAIRKISNTSPPFVGMSDNDNLMASINKLGRKLVDVAFNAAGLGEKEVADHGNVVRHSVIF